MKVPALPNFEDDTSVQNEATRLGRIFQGREEQLITLLANQLSVLKAKATSFLSLCGIAVTVTGFSGAHMIRAGHLSSAALVLGIFLILVAAVLSLRSLMAIRWVTQDLQDDLAQMAAQVIRRRNAQQHVLVLAGRFVAIGLGAYLVSVAIAAFSGHA
ncbi:MAG: hypothetical protein KC609_06495 [Myxococcales bacterium]|nr:hypothetical protein [Myxococcales bacterium]